MANMVMTEKILKIFVKLQEGFIKQEGFGINSRKLFDLTVFRNYRASHSISKLEPPHYKTNKMTLRPAKTQIFLHADTEDSDPTGRMPRLI